MIWLSKTWDWLKKNWKYVVTFGIPVLLSFIAGLLRSNRSLEKKVELEKDDFSEGDKVKWVDSKGNQEGTITKKNAKTVEIKSIKGENKRVPYKKLEKI